MSQERAAELTKMRDELQTKFADAMKSINQKIAAESGEDAEAENYKAVGQAAKELARVTDSTAAGVMALRQFPRQGGPKLQ
jgi:hypothetical protein